MVRKPCIDCGTPSEGTRCTECQRPVDRVKLRSKRVRRPQVSGETERRARVVAAYRREHGNVCPGWNREPHESGDLTADHPHAVGAGGSERQPLTVLCRSCNGAKGARE